MSRRFMIASLFALLMTLPVLAGNDASLANGRLQLTPPEDPWECTSIVDGGVAAFFTLPNKANMLISFVGNKAPVSPERAAAIKKDVLSELTAKFRRGGHEMVFEPREEPDARFFLIVHERWKKNGVTIGQWHVYNNLPPHQVVLTILGSEETEEDSKALLKAATDLVVSAKLVPPGTKAPPALVAKKPSAAEAPPKEDSPEKSAAAQALEDATAKVVAKLETQAPYKAASKRVADLDTKLKELRAQEPVDREKVADTARERLDAKGIVDGMRRTALDKDPAVIEARKKVAETKIENKPK